MPTKIHVTTIPYGPKVSSMNEAIANSRKTTALLRDGWRVVTAWTEIPTRAGAAPSMAVVVLEREGCEAPAPAASDAVLALAVVAVVAVLTLVAFL